MQSRNRQGLKRPSVRPSGRRLAVSRCRRRDFAAAPQLISGEVPGAPRCRPDVIVVARRDDARRRCWTATAALYGLSSRHQVVSFFLRCSSAAAVAARRSRKSYKTRSLRSLQRAHGGAHTLSRCSEIAHGIKQQQHGVVVVKPRPHQQFVKAEVESNMHVKATGNLLSLRSTCCFRRVASTTGLHRRTAGFRYKFSRCSRFFSFTFHISFGSVAKLNQLFYLYTCSSNLMSITP